MAGERRWERTLPSTTSRTTEMNMMAMATTTLRTVALIASVMKDSGLFDTFCWF